MTNQQEITNNQRKILYLNSDDDINGFIGGEDDINGHGGRYNKDKSIIVTKKDSHSVKKDSHSMPDKQSYTNDDYKFSPDISETEYKRRKKKRGNGINRNEDDLSMTNNKESDDETESDDEKKLGHKQKSEHKAKSDQEKKSEEETEKSDQETEKSDQEKKSEEETDEEEEETDDEEEEEDEETDDEDSENNDDDECNSMTTDELLTLDPLRLTNFLQFKNQNISEILSGVRDELKKLNIELKRRQKKTNK